MDWLWYISSYSNILHTINKAIYGMVLDWLTVQIRHIRQPVGINPLFPKLLMFTWSDRIIISSIRLIIIWQHWKWYDLLQILHFMFIAIKSISTFKWAIHQKKYIYQLHTSLVIPVNIWQWKPMFHSKNCARGQINQFI